MFYYCHRLTSITIPNGITSIDNYAFESCYILTSIIIPDGITNINYAVFRNCYSLISITIPDTITTIGNEAFYGCYSLKNVIMEKTTPPTLGQDAFSDLMSDFTIIVPAGSRESYIAATNWSSLADYIVEATV